MALSKDLYRELEDIVGPENLSDDPVVLDGYAYYQLSPMAKGPEDRFTQKAKFVVLPGNANEVQALVRWCNRRQFQCKASSTGYGAMNAPSAEKSVLLDMRRMNRIIDIDEKNMFIVVEPYVSFAEVQAEVHKRGLNCNILGAGSNASFLASYTSMVGNNTQAISQGYSGRNLLGVEWVLPTGELIRLGAPGSGAGWFTGDGPGPSLRGIMRGSTGATGGLGVFTKCAGHLHPWYGPTVMEVNGVSPYYEAEIPPNFEYHVIEWPSWERCADGQHKIGAAGIALALHKTGGPGSHGACVTGNNNEYYEARQRGELDLPEVSWAIVMAAYNAAEHDYQVKTLNRILEETGGKIIPVGEDPTWKKRDIVTMIKACFIPRLAFRLTGTFTTDGMLGQESADNCVLALKHDGRLAEKYGKKGAIMWDGIYNNWGVSYEGCHFALLEGGYQYDPLDEESIKGMDEMTREGTELATKMPIGLGWTIIGNEPSKMFGPMVGNHHHWMRRIKKSFDPNNVGDPMSYISAEEK